MALKKKKEEPTVTSKRLSGAHVPHNKNTTHCAPVRIPVPAKVRIPMSMHIGAPCTPTVKVGDLVQVGQPIGEAGGFVSAPIHSSVSGKVTAVEDMLMANGGMSRAVVIETDGEQTVWEGVKPPHVEDTASFIDAVRQSGLVGLGGAGFPTSVKLSVKDPTQVDYLLINGAECEPFITSDVQTMLNDADYVFKGAALIRKYVGAKNIVIGIEDNKPEAIELFRKRAGELENFSVAAMPSLYPQGGEKVMIYNITGRIVGEGKLPIDVGCIVMNVTSLAFLAKYMETGMPLVEKCVTIDGSAIAKPCNVIAPIGTSIHDIIEAAGGCKATPRKYLLGGAMMGMAAGSDELPMVKNTNAILVFDEKDAVLPAPSACINCGRCIDACPLNLMPNRINRAYKNRDAAALTRLKVNLCMECGCCSFVCPAKRELVLTNKLSKAFLREQPK